MRLHNTLTRKVEDFKPQKPGEITLYTCGPTVYNYYHIGNLRNAVFNDTLRRTLEGSGAQVKHVMNITDVGHLVSDADEGEDKLEKGAKREGKTVWEIAEHYTEAFERDMDQLNVLPPNVDLNRSKNHEHHDTYARATDFIPEQIDIVKVLMDKGFAYQTKQAIYFDVTKLPSYGSLTGQKLSEKEVAARSDVVADPDKHHPYDFAVWFFAVGKFAEHTMQWKTPWGNGFPGWHLECSAIIHTTLGDPIDIHTGGIDHIGTHHPNEMAQTEAAFAHPLARYWVHNEFILVNGRKMAKSKGNSYLLTDITKRNFHPMALRLLYLQAHYRTELNFTWSSLEAATQRLLAIQAIADMRFQSLSTKDGARPDYASATKNLRDDIEYDLRTPQALEGISQMELQVSQHGITDNEKKVFVKYIETLDSYLGLKLLDSSDITPEQKHLITEREAARAAKDWIRADELRDQLRIQNIELDDTPMGSRWHRTKL